MNTALLVLLTLNSVLALVLLTAWWRQRRLLAQMELRLSALQAAPAPSTELQQMAREAGPILAIRILNPLELALQKHWAAGALGRLTPGLLRQVVGREAARIAQADLARHGAQAEVRVLGGGRG